MPHFQGINLTYTIELDPNIEKHHIGFKLPPKDIRGVCYKMWKAIKLMAEKMTMVYPSIDKSKNSGPKPDIYNEGEDIQ